MIEIIDLCKTYKSKKGTDCAALSGVNLTLDEKGLVFLTGKSGSGKSTLLNLIGGLDKFDSGTIKLSGNDCKDFTQNDFDDFRNNFVGFIFQDCSLLEELNVSDNLKMVYFLQNSQPDENRINEVLSEVGLEGYGSRKINELSGGQRQRVAIARALLKTPKILLADEPTGALDYATGQQIFKLFTELSKKILVVVVSHDAQNVFRYADRIVELQDGKIISDRTKQGDFNYDILKQSFEDEVDGFFKPSQPLEIEKKELSLGSGRLALSQTLRTGIHNLFAKKFRLILTVFLSVVILSLFGVLFSFSTYNKVNSALKSFAKFEIDTLELRNIDEENSLLGSFSHKSFEYEEYLAFKEDYDYAQKTLYFNGRLAHTAPRYLTELNDSSVEQLEAFYGAKLLNGRMPTSSDRAVEHEDGRLYVLEILISDYIADNLLERRTSFMNGDVPARSSYNSLIGKQQNNGAYCYEIVGIYSTDYKDFGVIKNYDSTEYRFKRAYVYQTALAIQNEFHTALMYCEGVTASMSIGRGGVFKGIGTNSVLISNGAREFATTFMSATTYSSVEGFGLTNLTKLLNKNQVIISLSFYNVLASAFDLPELENEQDVDFSQLKNLDLRLSSEVYAVAGFDVVAVYNDEPFKETKNWNANILVNLSNYSNCLIRLEVIERIRLAITDDYNQNHALLVELGNRRIDYQAFITNDLKIFEQINYFLGDFLWAICLTVFVFAGLLFYSFISNNIGAKKKDIGILRAIGAKGKDISKIFFFEGLILGLVNFVMSCGLTALGVFALNLSLTKFSEYKISVIRLNIWSIVIILVLNFSIILISGLLSVRHLTKQKPIDVIKNS